MRVVRSGTGVRMQFGPVEVQTLAELITELLDELGADPDPEQADAVRERLYPAAYADPDADRAFRQMTHSGLHSERVERAERCLSDLAESPERVSALARRAQIEVVLSEEDGDRWMRVLNDLRLTIGTRLGVTEDEDRLATIDPEDPQAMPYVVYGWLTALQDGLVHALMG